MFYKLSRILRSKRQGGRDKQTVYRSFIVPHAWRSDTCTAALATGTTEHYLGLKVQYLRNINIPGNAD